MRIKSLLFAAAFVAALTLTAPAQTTPVASTFSITSTDIGATNSHAIISAAGPGVAEIDFLNATSDKATSAITFYTAGSGVLVTLASNATQTVVYAPGTGNFAANDIVVLRHVAADTYQRLVVSSAAATTTTFTGNATATVAGDVIYKLTAGATIPIGTNANGYVSFSGPVYRGQKGKPTYLEIDGTSACQINLISGRFRTYAAAP